VVNFPRPAGAGRGIFSVEMRGRAANYPEAFGLLSLALQSKQLGSELVGIEQAHAKTRERETAILSTDRRLLEAN
jgi:hypothetical protein